MPNKLLPNNNMTKDKTTTQIVNAFDKIVSEGRIPKRLCTDAAKDFTLSLKKITQSSNPQIGNRHVEVNIARF